MKKSCFSKILMAVCLSSISIGCLAAGLANREWPDVACRYEMKVTAYHNGKAGPIQRHDWYFWRNANMVQTRSADGRYGEIWELTATGSVYYQKLYHDDATAVEFMPADILVNQLNLDWFKLANMLGQQELEGLKVIKKTKVLGREAQIRTSLSGTRRLEVTWLTAEQIPASIIKKNHAQRLELKLVEISSITQALAKPVDAKVIAGYRHIEAADFGDMENDAFVKKLLAAEAHAHH